MNYTTLEDWVRGESISFSLESAGGLEAAVDQVMERVGERIELLGLGEALHGGEEILLLRNRLFERLVEGHGFKAIAIESSYPRGRLVDGFVAGAGGSIEGVMDQGFSHGFGALDTSRELVEWMRAYNATVEQEKRLRFYGFDSPTEMMGADSPRELLRVAVEYLEGCGGERWKRVEGLLGDEGAWVSPQASFDPAKAVGGSEDARALRLEVEDLIGELGLRRPEGARGERAEAYREAVHCAAHARQMLNYHAELARASADRVARLLGMRDLMMAENLTYAVGRERARGGKVLAYAHNSHLKKGRAQWQWGPQFLTWWPAGAHVAAVMGEAYVVIGTGVGESEQNGIGRPEAGSIEARLTGTGGRFVATRGGRSIDAAAGFTVRSGSQRNQTYFPLAEKCLEEFDWLAVLDSVTYNRGGRPLP